MCPIGRQIESGCLAPHHIKYPTAQRPVGVLDSQQVAAPLDFLKHLMAQCRATRGQRPIHHRTYHPQGTLLAHPKAARGTFHHSAEHLINRLPGQCTQLTIEHFEQFTVSLLPVLECRAPDYISFSFHGRYCYPETSNCHGKVRMENTPLLKKSSFFCKIPKTSPRTVL